MRAPHNILHLLTVVVVVEIPSEEHAFVIG